MTALTACLLQRHLQLYMMEKKMQSYAACLETACLLGMPMTVSDIQQAYQTGGLVQTANSIVTMLHMTANCMQAVSALVCWLGPAACKHCETTVSLSTRQSYPCRIIPQHACVGKHIL